MNPLAPLQAAYRDIVNGRPGHRFTSHYRRQRARNEVRWRTTLMIGVGLLLVAAGAILGPVPGMPGLILGIPGLALIASRLEIAARLLDRGERVIRRILRKHGGKVK